MTGRLNILHKIHAVGWHDYFSWFDMLTLLCALLILAVFVVFAFWLIDKIGLQPDTSKMLKILAAAIAAVIAIGWFAGWWGSGFKWR